MKRAVDKKMLQRFLFILGVIVFNGCSLFSQSFNRYQNDQQALTLLNQLNQVKAPDRFKGIGTFKLEHGAVKDSFRSVWAGYRSERKVRIELLDILGKPVVSLASNGKYLYFLSHSPKKFYKKRGVHRTLKRYLTIPISLDQILDILSGRIEIKKYHHAFYDALDKESRCKITLKNRANKTIQTLYLNPSNVQLEKAEFFDRSENLIYDVNFESIKMTQGYQVAWKITISDSENVLKLLVSKIYIDPELEPELFSLSP